MKSTMSDGETNFDSSINETKSHSAKDQEFLDNIKHFFLKRSNLEKDFLKSLQSIVFSFSKKMKNVENSQLKSIANYLCQDWMNTCQQRTKLAEEFESLGTTELDKFLTKIKNFSQNFIRQLETIKKQSDSQVRYYKNLETSFLNSQAVLTKLMLNTRGVYSDDKKILNQKKQTQYLQDKLFKFTKTLLSDKVLLERNLASLNSNYKHNQNRLIKFSFDLGMKNFISQVNYLKNREYDTDMLIREFQKPKTISFDRDVSFSTMTSTKDQSFSDSPKIDLPFELHVPNQDFMNKLERKFYTNIHYKLLNRPFAFQSNTFRTLQRKGSIFQINFDHFRHETIILSRLFDGKKLNESEEIIIKNLYLKDSSDKFLYYFFVSFLEYKRNNITIKEDSMNFFLKEVFARILHPLIKNKTHSSIFRLIQKLQQIKISISLESSTILVSNNTNFMLPKKEKHRSRSISINRSLFAEDSLITFRQYISQNFNCLNQVLSLEDFWIYCLKEIFSNVKAPSNLPFTRPRTVDKIGGHHRGSHQSNSRKSFEDQNHRSFLKSFTTLDSKNRKYQTMTREYKHNPLSKPPDFIILENYQTEQRKSTLRRSNLKLKYITNRARVSKYDTNTDQLPGNDLVSKNLSSCKHFLNPHKYNSSVLSSLNSSFPNLQLRSVDTGLNRASILDLKYIFFIENEAKSVNGEKLLSKIRKLNVSIFN